MSDHHRLKTITQEEFDDLVQRHIERQNKSDLKNPHRLNLQWHDLRSVDLSCINIERAMFNNCDFKGAQLIKTGLAGAVFKACDLSGANLSQSVIGNTDFEGSCMVGINLDCVNDQHEIANNATVNFTNTDLTDATAVTAKFPNPNMRNAILRNAVFDLADFSTARNLTAEQLGGASLKGTKLPDEIASFSPLETAREAAKRAGKVWFGLLALCTFSVLTAFATSDVQLILNEPTIQLPTVGTVLATQQLFWILPVTITMLSFFFCLNMHDLWMRLSRLPAVFPDGVPLDRKVHPWLFNSLARRHMKVLREDTNQELSVFGWFYTVFLAWLMAPLTVILLLFRYLRIHDYGTTYSTLAVMCVLLWIFAAIFHTKAVRTLSGSNGTFRWGIKAYIFVGVALLCVGAFGTWASSKGRWPILNANIENAYLASDGPRTIRLENRNLIGARARDARFNYSFLKNVDFRMADLRYADFGDVYFDSVNLRGALLNYAHFGSHGYPDRQVGGVVYLQHADLREASGLYEHFLRHQMKGAAVHSAEFLHPGAVLISADSVWSPSRDSVFAE